MPPGSAGVRLDHEIGSGRCADLGGVFPGDSQPGQTGGAEGRADIAAGMVVERTTKYVGENPAPQAAARTATNDRNATDFRPRLSQHSLPVGKGVRDPFQNRAGKVCTVVVMV